MEEKSKKKITVSIITVLLVVFTIGISYAFISQVLIGTKEVVVSAGVLDLVLEEENEITISDALPMYDEVGMMQEDVFIFRLVNKTNNPTNYVLKLSKFETANELSLSDVKYYLTKEGVGEPQFLSDIPNNGTVDSGIIAGNDTIDYTLRLWIDSRVTDQQTITGKSLSYKLVVDLSQDLMFVKALDDIVIDFGLPVEIKHSKLDEGRIVEDLSYATYGKVEIEGDSSKEDFTIRYTPAEILQGIDTVHLLTDDNKEYTFNVYPATTVYYEESFIDWDEKWTIHGETSITHQKSQLLGKSADEYGYDEIYESNKGASADTQAVARDMNATGIFSFTGTGLDVYANCIKDSGDVYFLLRNSAGKSAGLYIVHTAVNSGETGQTEYTKNEYYHMLIANIRDLPYDTYTVTVKVCSKDKPVYIDGIRVYGTIDHNSNIYANDNEQNPTYVEIRDSVLSMLGVDKNEINNDQIYQKIEEKSGAVLLGIDFTNEMIQDLLDNGPKGELFLQPGQAVIFALNDGVNAQIGLHAPAGSTNYKISSSTEEITLNSSVDMFYHNLSGQVAIANTGNNILSITKLKVFNVTDSVFTDISIDTVNEALDMLNN